MPRGPTSAHWAGRGSLRRKQQMQRPRVRKASGTLVEQRGHLGSWSPGIEKETSP